MAGPSIMFAESLCSWTGDEMMMHGTLHFEKHLTFTATLKNFIRKSIQLENVGSTVIYYSWELLRPEINFDVIIPSKRKVKFFFNTSSGVLTPGSTKEIMITFYSRDVGLFTETWQFLTKPVLCGGANVWLRLRGASMSEDDNDVEISRIEKYLLHQQTIHMVKTILKYLISTIHSPVKVQEFQETEIFREEETFELNNPQLSYHRDVIEQLHLIYARARLATRSWDLTFETLEASFYENEKFKDREDAVEHVEELKAMLEHPRLVPLTMGSYHITYILLVQTIDRMVSESGNIILIINSIIARRKDLVMVYEKNVVTKIDESEKSYLEDIIPPELCLLMRQDKKIKEKYHEILYLLVYSLMSEIAESMNAILEDAWF